VKDEPSLDQVVERLLTLSVREYKPSPELYAHLAHNWDELSEKLRQQLHTAAVFWDGKQYWKANEIHPDEHEPWFGNRRMYRAGLSHENMHLLPDRTDAVPVALSWDDHLAIIKEVALHHRDGQPVKCRDRQL
jgi:hypothetical protein